MKLLMNKSAEHYFFSVVIPLYNRSWSIERAILSAINFRPSTVPLEIIIVDDGSSDDSLVVAQSVTEKYSYDKNIRFKIIVMPQNRGVCSAKNLGANNASGKWIIFLDSDDELLPGIYSEIKSSLEATESYPLHFFSCLGEDQIAPSVSMKDVVRHIDVNTLHLRGTGGEALPIVLATVFKLFNYDEDIRGYESLAYSRMIKHYNYALVHSTYVRRYYSSHLDRLSSRQSLRRRSGDLAKGHIRILSEHFHSFNSLVILVQVLRYIKAKFLSFI